MKVYKWVLGMFVALSTCCMRTSLLEAMFASQKSLLLCLVNSANLLQ